MKTVNDLVAKMLELFPYSNIEEDRNGELIVYTALTADESENLVEIDQDTQLENSWELWEES